MRTEKEMFDLILRTAKTDDRIRAVLLSGSRADPNAPKDKYQDYDITYYVNDVSPFYNNLGWIEKNFSTPAIMQLPELMKHPLLPPDNDGHFTYLMLFEDGNRFDLSIECKPYKDEGEPAVILLNKDGFLPAISPKDNYWSIKAPNETIFSDCCNEFWWCLNNVAKGIMRDELSYAMKMYHHYVRDMLNQMAEWYIGLHYDFSVSAGKMGKYFKRYLPEPLYELYVRTYSNGDYAHFWTAIFTTCDLFRILALTVSRHFGYTYNQSEDKNMTEYLHKMKNNDY